MNDKTQAEEPGTEARDDDWKLRAELIRAEHETVITSAKQSEQAVRVLLDGRDLDKAGISREGEVPKDVLEWLAEFENRAGKS